MISNIEDSPLRRIAKFVSLLVDGQYPDLDEHHQRLMQNVTSFARYLNWSTEEIELLSIGANIHDIGKLSISEHILNKPARLTSAEFSLVKQHTSIGARLLEPLGLDPRISEIAYYHHENYDGSGYPEGLTGESIPLMARVVRIWDSYDAITMDRPYHKGISSDEAISVLKRHSHHFDPFLLKAFFEMLNERRADKPQRHYARRSA